MGTPQEDGLKLNLDFARSLRMRRRVAIAVGTLVLVGLVFFALTRKPYYEATALIYVQPIVEKSATDPSSGMYDSMRYDAYMAQQLLTFDRPDILGHALDQLPPAIRATFSDDKAKAIKQLEGRLTVDRLPGSYEIRVSMGRGDPVTVAPIANAVASAYLANGQQDDLALTDQQLTSLEQERQNIQDELQKDRQQQADLSGALGVADTGGDNANPFDSQLADLRTQLAAARNAHAVAEAQLAALKGKQAQSSSSLDAAADSLTRSDSELSAMKASLGTQRGTILAEMSGLTPENPLYVKDKAQLDNLTQTINSLTNDVKRKTGQTLEQQYALAAAQTGDVQARLEADLERQTAAATADTPKLQQAQDLAESVKLLQARYADVDNAIHTLSLAQAPTFAAHTSLEATPPTGPRPSKKILILVLALPIAIFFGVCAALLRQKLDSHIYIGGDVDGVLHFPPMAVLPDAGEVGHKVEEEFLFRLVAGLDQAHRVSGASTFIFTATSQETSFDDLVSSVSAELELLGYRTMTLSAAEALSPIESTGKDSFSDWQESTELARSSSETRLRIRRESLIDEHLERLKQKVDFLFIKAQPLRSSSETEFVVRLGDVTVLVVESAKTTRHELRSCLSLIQRLRARGLAAVLTNLHLRNADDDFIDSVRFAGQRQDSNSRAKFTDGMLTIGRP
jgi:uncharacterized protein involved in exopolysaccharide biosynthesis